MKNSANEFQHHAAWQAMIAELLFVIPDEGNMHSLCFLDANQLMLDNLNYTKQELEDMRCDVGKNIFNDENHGKFIEMIQNLKCNGHMAKCGDLLKMKTKNNKNVWIFWKFTVLEWYKRDSPKIFLGWGIIDDEDMHAVKQARKWLIEQNQLRNKAKNDSLTKRELEVIHNITDGLTSKEIGEKLFVTKNAVEKRLQKIYRKLEVAGHAALVIYIHENGLD